MRKLVLLLIVTLVLSSCGVAFQYSTLNHSGHSDGIYSQPIKIDTINSVSKLRWKFQRDWKFANNWKRFALNQDYNWWRNHYWDNRVWRRGWSSAHQLYRHNWEYLYGSNFWTPEPAYPWFDYWHPYNVRHHRYWGFYYNQPYGWYINNHWGYSHYTDPTYSYNYNYGRRNTYAYINGRRGSTNSNIEQDTNRRNRSRTYNNPTNQIIRNLRGRGINVDVITTPPDGTNVIRPPRINTKPIVPNSNTRPIRNYNESRPDTNNGVVRPRTNYNNSRGSSNISRGNNSSGGSSRGTRGKNND